MVQAEPGDPIFRLATYPKVDPSPYCSYIKFHCLSSLFQSVRSAHIMPRRHPFGFGNFTYVHGGSSIRCGIRPPVADVRSQAVAGFTPVRPQASGGGIRFTQVWPHTSGGGVRHRSADPSGTGPTSTAVLPIIGCCSLGQLA